MQYFMHGGDRMNEMKFKVWDNAYIDVFYEIRQDTLLKVRNDVFFVLKDSLDFTLKSNVYSEVLK